MSATSDIAPPVVERLGPPDVPEVITFLDADPTVNVYLLALVLRDALARPRDEYWVARRAGRITALLFLGGTSGAVLPVGDDLQGVRALGEQGRRRLELMPRRFQVIGQRAVVSALLEHVPGAGHTPRLERECARRRAERSPDEPSCRARWRRLVDDDVSRREQ